MFSLTANCFGRFRKWCYHFQTLQSEANVYALKKKWMTKLPNDPIDSIDSPWKWGRPFPIDFPISGSQIIVVCRLCCRTGRRSARTNAPQCPHAWRWVKTRGETMVFTGKELQNWIFIHIWSIPKFQGPFRQGFHTVLHTHPMLLPKGRHEHVRIVGGHILSLGSGASDPGLGGM